MSDELSQMEFDYVLVGGGLQAGLLALAIRHHHRSAAIALVERENTIAGNHTWSFHPGDVPEASRPWISPLIEHQWDSYEVRVGDIRRDVSLSYASISSEHFADVVSKVFSQACSSRLLCSTDVAGVEESRVVTSKGHSITGRCVIDCRGPSSGKTPFAGCGFQKFHGFEIVLPEDWPFERPVIMDSRIDQQDGFRFLYTLPFDSNRVLVEDTRFSDTPDCERAECLEAVRTYLQPFGIDRFDIVREESGVLPMPYSSELMPEGRRPLAGGYAGGWFHAATGYSFPMAVAFAEAIASGPLETAGQRVTALQDEHRWRARFSRFLNRLLFGLVAPRHRYRIFQRFYRVLGRDAIERFYSHQFSFADAFRIVVGIPPTLIGLRPISFLKTFSRGVST
ncbi:MAG: lycopene beta-cyclase CrtY [Planctomycetota bacterium]